MSDTFDHEGDAWDSYEQGREGESWGCSNWSRGRSSFNYDPLHYHTKVRFTCLSNTTDKAVQLQLEDGRQVWVPRSVCRDWDDRSVWVHRKTWTRSLKNATRPMAPEDLMDLLPDD